MMTGKKIPLATMGVLAFGSAHKIPEIPWKTLKPLEKAWKPLKTLEHTGKHLKTLENTWKNMKTIENTGKHLTILENTWETWKKMTNVEKCWKTLKNTENTSKNTWQFPLAPMGVLAPGSAHAKPSAQLPIDTSRNFSAHVSGMGDKKNENLSDQFTQAILSTFHFFCKKNQKNVPPGAGVLRIFVHPKSYFFVSQTLCKM
jgi:hypothetical protein